MATGRRRAQVCDQERSRPMPENLDQAGDVILVPAKQSDAVLLDNLLEHYLHDMSEIFPIEVGADGRFGYARLPLYWSETETRFPFLIRAGSRVVGFILV